MKNKIFVVDNYSMNRYHWYFYKVNIYSVIAFTIISLIIPLNITTKFWGILLYMSYVCLRILFNYNVLDSFVYKVEVKENYLILCKQIPIINIVKTYIVNIADLSIVEDKKKILDIFGGYYTIIYDNKNQKEYRISSAISDNKELKDELFQLISAKTNCKCFFWEKTRIIN